MCDLLESLSINSQDVIILDGGLATELERQGADLSGHLWSARLLKDDPDLIVRTHRAYYLAGADVATTASYQATVGGFERLGLDKKTAEDLIRSSVNLAKKARDEAWISSLEKEGRHKPIVAASIGCYGASLADGSEYRGDYTLTKEELKDFHRPRMLLLGREGPDIFACETIPCITEAIALADLLDEPEIAAMRIPAWISISCRDGAHLASGEPIADLMSTLAARAPPAGGGGTSSSSACRPLLAAVGVNCTAPQHVTSALAAISAGGGAALPLVCYPNKGEEWDSGASGWRPDTAVADDHFACACAQWRAAGARLIGGCCRTTPDTIAAVRRALIPTAAAAVTSGASAGATA